MGSKCQFCEKPATICAVKIDAVGCMKEVFLCKTHAKARGAYLEGGYAIIDDVVGKKTGIVLSHNICPKCGCSREWIEDSQHLGCAECCRVFPEVVEQVYRGFKNCPVYLGKVPSTSHKETMKTFFLPRLQFLEDRMRTFVQAENFEEAHKIKSEVQRIKQNFSDASVDI